MGRDIRKSVSHICMKPFQIFDLSVLSLGSSENWCSSVIGNFFLGLQMSCSLNILWERLEIVTRIERALIYDTMECLYSLRDAVPVLFFKKGSQNSRSVYENFSYSCSWFFWARKLVGRKVKNLVTVSSRFHKM